MAGWRLSPLAAAALVLLLASARATPSLVCPQRFHGLRLTPNATLSRRRVATCGAGRAPGYTCCGRVEEAQLVKADAACRATASEACCAALAALRCVACDGPSQLGLLHGVAPALCGSALDACGGDYFARDALTGTAHLCVDDSLLCARADDLVHAAATAGGAADGTSFCGMLGYPVVGGSGGGDAAGGSSNDGDLGLGRLPDAGGDSDGSAAAPAGAYDELVRLQKAGFTGFPTALDAATATTLERAMARQAREREAAAAAAAATAGTGRRRAAGGLLDRLAAAAGSPLAAALAAIAVTAAFLGRQPLRRWLRRGGGGGSGRVGGPPLPPAALRAARQAHLDRLAAASAAPSSAGGRSGGTSSGRPMDDSDDSDGSDAG